MSYSSSQILAIIWSWIEIVGYIGGGIYSYNKYEKSKELIGLISEIAKSLWNQENHLYIVLFDEKIVMTDFWMACIVLSGIGILSAVFLMIGVIKKLRPMLIPWMTTQIAFILVAIVYIVYNGPQELYLVPAGLTIVWFFMQYVSANLHRRERIIRQYDPKSAC